MSEIALIHDKWTTEKLAKMNLDDLREIRTNDSIFLQGIDYSILEIKRVPETEGGHNDTFLTYVYVEKSSKTCSAI